AVTTAAAACGTGQSSTPLTASNRSVFAMPDSTRPSCRCGAMLGQVGRVRIGTSGWRYPAWRGRFYPTGLPQRCELAYLAQRVNSVEINGSFYSLQRPEWYRAWSVETPD